MFTEKYEHHKLDYYENGYKYGNKVLPHMVANERQNDSSFQDDEYENEYS